MSRISLVLGAVLAAGLLGAPPAQAAPGPQQGFSLTVRSDQSVTLATATGWVAYDTSGTSAQYEITACKTSSAYGGAFLAVSGAPTEYPNYGCTTYTGTISAGGARIASTTVSLTAGTFLRGSNTYATWTRSATLNDPF
jgi:hypothetical protein